MRSRHMEKESHKTRNIIILVVIVVVAIVLAFLGYGAYKYKSASNQINKAYKSAGIKKTRDTDALLNHRKPVSILLLGTDTGALDRNYKGRTDTIMVATLNPETKKMTLTSIPRDTAVNIPGYPQDSPSKINAAYTYGSAGTAIKTVEKLLNVPIDFYALINMGGLKEIVDQVGGVTITPTLSFSYEGYTFKKGQPTKMDGKEALSYSQMRYDDPAGDYGRTMRQRQILQAIAGKGASVSQLMNNDFISSIAKSSQTDLSSSDLTKLAAGYREHGDFVDNHLQGENQMIANSAMQVPTESQLQQTTNFIRKNLGLPAAKTGSAAYH
ncbi:LCP family protein [Fructilactobacillus fructivorans]|uniref:LCP family protein n=1 Tax=Fructilactobacillus fructivorans TaxID=1614 RepID=UPI000ADFB007|nr:LCP family protein [Fructilactobacillus fructivorans]